MIQSIPLLIDVIDIRHWHYQADGTTYEPKGGQNLPQGNMQDYSSLKKTSFEQVYRAVKECKEKYPDKVVIYSGDSYTEYGIAAYMAGGSLAALPNGVDATVINAAITMKPTESNNKEEYILSDGKNKIIYNTVSKKLEKK